MLHPFLIHDSLPHLSPTLFHFQFSLTQGYRSTQKAIVDMTDKVAEVDQLKGSTLEDISSMVDQINREFKNKQAQLQPLMAELKVCTCLCLLCMSFMLAVLRGVV